MKKDYIITLEDNKEYALVKMIEKKDKKYVYLMDIHDYNNFIFGELVGTKINRVTDDKLLSELIIEFAKKEK